MRGRQRIGPAGVLALALALAGSSGAGEEVRPEDVVSLIALEQRLLAVNPVTGPAAELDLELGERLVEVRSRGLLGVATTDRRVLGISSGSASWVELRYRLQERDTARGGAPARIHLADRVALVVLPQRLIGLGSGQGAWQAISIGPGEQIVDVRTGARVAGVVTSRRVLGFSRHSGFVEVALSPREQVDRAILDDRAITLVTSHRVLIFQDGAGRWTWLHD